MAEEALEAAALDKKAAKKAEKAKKKEEKKQSKGQADPETEEESSSAGSKLLVVVVTFVIVAIWIAILALLVRLDVGGFGSTVLQPILKDVPYVNKILPKVASGEEPIDAQYPYATLDEAVNRIKELELEVSQGLETQKNDAEYVQQLEAENNRLQQFEQEQATFEELKTKFYKEVIYADNAPDIKEYQSYYESIDPANAEILYKQVVAQSANDQEVLDYANTYAGMKPKQAAAILEQMTDKLKLVAKILENMQTQARADILGAMDPVVAAKLTEIMEP
ncbi:hypothetical protein LQZ18_06595 [Lachnospiraceae bacterium ZAX-1]